MVLFHRVGSTEGGGGAPWPVLSLVAEVELVETLSFQHLTELVTFRQTPRQCV